jgi:hypothetical protein
LTRRIEPHTFDDMKDAVVTVRLRSVTKRRVAKLAKRDGRSLSAQIERLVEAGLNGAAAVPPIAGASPRSLAGIFAGTRVPTRKDFREVRAELSRSLLKRAR